MINLEEEELYFSVHLYCSLHTFRTVRMFQHLLCKKAVNMESNFNTHYFITMLVLMIQLSPQCRSCSEVLAWMFAGRQSCSQGWNCTTWALNFMNWDLLPLFHNRHIKLLCFMKSSRSFPLGHELPLRRLKYFFPKWTTYKDAKIH